MIDTYMYRPSMRNPANYMDRVRAYLEDLRNRINARLYIINR